MYTPLVRMILCLMALGLTALGYFNKDYTTMFLGIISLMLFIYGYFRYGTVYLAFQQIKKQNNSKAEKLLLKIRNPNNLSKEQRGYYHFSWGVIHLDNEKLEKGISELKQALDFKLRTENDKSIVLLNIANGEFELGNINTALSYIEKIEKLKLKPLVEEETKRLKEKATQHAT